MIPDPDEYQLNHLGLNSVLASVPSWQYHKNRETPWVYVCGSYTSEEIFKKIEEVTSKPLDDYTRLLVIALLTAFSFRPIAEAQPFLDQLEVSTDHWIQEIKNRVTAQCVDNSVLIKA